MKQLLIISLSLLSEVVLAQSYQIDLIVFAHPNQTALTVDTPLIPINKHAISLKKDTDKTAKSYHLLASSFSALRDEYYLLSRKSSYQVLGFYSWRQPANNQSSVALPLTHYQGWQLQGTVTVTQNTYYSFTAELQASPPYNSQSSFTVSQKQRLKDNVVYYFDNPYLGMLVKIHHLVS